MAGVCASHRLVVTGCSSLSAASGTLTNLKSSLRLLYSGRGFSNWHKTTSTHGRRKIDNGLAVTGCSLPALQR